MIGTTQFTNAFVENKRLEQVAVVRLGYPATVSVPPCIDFSDNLRKIIGENFWIVNGGYEFDGRLLGDWSEDEIIKVAIQIKNKKLKYIKNKKVFSPINEKQEIDTANIIKKYNPNSEYAYISDLLKLTDKNKKIISYDISSSKKIILVSVKNNITSTETEGLGAKFYDNFNNSKLSSFIIISDTIKCSLKNFAGFFLHGLKLKSYTFEKYKSKKNKKNISITITGKNKPTLNDQIKFKAIENGTFFARDQTQSSIFDSFKFYLIIECWFIFSCDSYRYIFFIFFGFIFFKNIRF
jgi:hypothetical protein